eukprot:6177547-Pleurochrysis_carterae.AAC.3
MATATSSASTRSASDAYGSASADVPARPVPGPRHAAIALRAARNAPPRSRVLQSADPRTAEVSPSSHPSQIVMERELVGGDHLADRAP